MLTDILYAIVVTLVPLILAIAVHEFAHIAAARYLGDDLGTRLGRFTLDPTKHIDPLWTVALPALLVVVSAVSGSTALPFFAAGKPAPYNPRALTREFFGKRISLRNAEMIVAAAGPLSNLLLAALSMGLAVLAARLGFGVVSGIDVISALFQFVVLNVALFLFNLVPIPPLDGSKVIQAFLPYNAAAKYGEFMTRWSSLLFILLLFKGASLLTGPILFVTNLLRSLFGL